MNAAPLHTRQSTGKIKSASVLALVFFAIAGLFFGMIVGALTHQKTPSTPPVLSKINVPVVKTQKSTATPTPTATAVAELPHLGLPQTIGSPQISSIAPSTLTVQAVNKDTKQPIQTNTITCRLWLTNKNPTTLDKDSANKLYAALMSVGTLAQPLPDELPNSVTYSDPTLPATHATDAQGQCKWNFQITPGLAPGNYFLVADTDWKGLRYPFSYYFVTIAKP
ncbi:MAG TPA: hypothetical protein VFN23_00095 [Ktedonobacteraceae bacterium]|nr:hypothetical protein [Ktedonobacteraceae bacterium]